MDSSSLQRMRIYLHLIPVFGVVPSLWTLYGEGSAHSEERAGEESTSEDNKGEEPIKTVSRLSVVVGLSCIIAIALLAAGADSQVSQYANLRFLIASSFVGSGYFLLNVSLMFRVAKGQSIRLPGISQLSRRLP